jgi:hypothetical protein
MKNTKHTPGPWQFNEYSHYTDFTIWGGDGSFPIVTEFDDRGDHTVTTANARLIAAAPDLLAALQRAEALLRIAFNPGIDKNVTLCASSCQWAANEARLALAKAQGEKGGAE